MYIPTSKSAREETPDHCFPPLHHVSNNFSNNKNNLCTSKKWACLKIFLYLIKKKSYNISDLIYLSVEES